MFTKLKNKIAEEVKQSPLKLSASVQQLAQAVVSPSNVSQVERASNEHFTIGDDSEETPQNSPSKSSGFQSVDLHAETPVSSPMPSGGGRSRHSSTSSVMSDASSLFPIFESSVTNSFSLQSDLESASEVEDSFSHQLDRISKEQLYTAYRKVQARYTKYKGRYADLARHYRELDRENVKAKTILVESQDKALRRIAELKEQCQLEQKAKAHLEDALRNDLEEKDHLISTLYTKIELLKLNGGKDEEEQNSQKADSPEKLLIDLSVEPSPTSPTKQVQEEMTAIQMDATLKEKVGRLESLLSKCKESIKRNKERISQLTLENQQLEQTLEDTKVTSSTQISTLTGDLTTSRQEIVRLVEALDTLRKREEDAALSLAENKLTIHRELEAKEEQIRSLRDSLTQLTRDKESLIERATSLQNEVMELKSIATSPSTDDASSPEEDRQNLIQELSRGKAEAVKLLQQEMQKKLTDLEKKMVDKLQTSEETNSKLEDKIKIMQQEIEEKDKENRDLELKMKILQKENVLEEDGHSDFQKNIELGTVMKDLENKLLVAEKKLAEKENVISDQEAKTKLVTDELNAQLMIMKSKVEAELNDRLQAESRLSERDHEIKELSNKHKQQLEEGHKMLTEVEVQLRMELSKKSETEKKYKDLLNTMGNMEDSLKNRDSDVHRLSSEIKDLKERIQNLESDLQKASEECTKVIREKDNAILILRESLKSVAQLKHLFQALKIYVNDKFKNLKEDITMVGIKVVDTFENTQSEGVNLKRELQEKNSIENNLRQHLFLLEKELAGQKENTKSESNLESMLRDLQLSKTILETKLSESNALVTKLRHKLENTMKTLENKEQELSKLSACIADLQQELTQCVEKANSDFENLKREHAKKIETKDEELSREKNKYDESHHKVEALQNDMKNAENRFDEINEDYEALKLENDKLIKKVKELEDKGDLLKAEFAAITEERAALVGTTEKLTSALTEHKEENYILNKKIEDFSVALNCSNSETTRFRDQAEEAANSLMKINKENEILKKEIEELKEALQKSEENLKSEEEAWNSKSAKMKKLETLARSLQKELKNEKQQFEIETSKLCLQLEQYQQKEKELSSEMDLIKEGNVKAKENQSNYESHISNLRSELQEILQREQLLSDEVENLKKENASHLQLLKEKETHLENVKAEKDTIVAKGGFDANKVLELEGKLFSMTEEKEMWLKEHGLFEVKEKELEQLKFQLEQQLEGETEQKKLLQEEFNKVKDNNELLIEQLAELNSLVESLKNKNQDDGELVEKLKVERLELQETLDSEVELNKNLSSKIESLDAKLFNFDSENRTLASEIASKVQELAELQKKCEIHISEKNIAEETRLKLDEVCVQKTNVEKELEILLKKNETLQQHLTKALDEQTEERLQLEKVSMENKELQVKCDNTFKEKLFLEQTLTTVQGNLQGLQKELDNILKEKTDLEQALTTKQEKLEGLQTDIIEAQDKYHLETSELKKQLEEALLEKTDLEHRLNAEVERARGMQEAVASDLLKLRTEKEQLEQQLDDTLVDMQAKEKQISELEEIHVHKIKQLVHDFEIKLAKKEEEFAALKDRKFEIVEQEENVQVREYRDHIRQLHEASEAQGEAFQQLYIQHEEAMQKKNSELSNCEHRIQELTAAHQRELSEVDKRWRQCLEQQLAESEARHKEELAELSKEWHWERKNHVSDTETALSEELESTSQLAVAAVESGTGSIELLHRQLVAQTNELKEAKRLHRLEVTELRRLLSLRRISNSSDRIPGHTTLEDACTELEYLRNILYEYMMGKEPVVLARVIAAVVKFDSEQTTKVLQKEEQKQTLLGQLGIL